MQAYSASIRQTIRDFRSECADWEDEVLELFQDVDQFLATAARPDEQAAGSRVAEDVAGLRGLVEQQTEVLAALVNVLTASPCAADAEFEEDAESEQDQQVGASPDLEVDPFERLQQAVAAAAEAN